MLAVDKNLKDSSKDMNISLMGISFSMSYTKTHKLITALYMVTDIMDKEEPIRYKLRSLGTEIISDIYSMPINACVKINQIMSFLDIASAMSFISEMNCNILKKEFLELNSSIKESKDRVNSLNRQINLSEFLDPHPTSPLLRGRSKEGVFKGHTRIGIQKGSTLMKALSDKTKFLSNNNSEARPNVLGLASRAIDFNIFKKQRRDNIIAIIKNNGGNASIKDIKIKANDDNLLACSEKTLQRELMSMTKNGVLNKTGEKRWSRYSLLSQIAKSS